jgi:hypothetical protein
MADRIELAASSKGQDAFDVIKRVFDGKKDILQKNSEKAKDHMNNALGFCEKAFGLGQEIVLLVTEMTAENSCARFISRYGCEQYYRFNKDLLFNERQTELLREIDEILI